MSDPDSLAVVEAVPDRKPIRIPSGGGLIRQMLIVLAGILLGQAILYGPSLVGLKILLPLDILGLPGNYLPQTPAVEAMFPHNHETSDQIDLGEPTRQFNAKELHAGRLPLWNPSQFAGAPSTCPKFSPFVGLLSWFKSPLVLPWVQCLLAVVGGVGCFLFFRTVLKIGFWPATFAAWSYPLTAFMVAWQGTGIPCSVVWLPWLLVAVDGAVRKPGVLSCCKLAIVTAFTLVSGQLDMAAQVLLVSGIYSLWAWLRILRIRGVSRSAAGAVAGLILGWGIGFCLAAPDIFPLMEYTHAGARMERRSLGNEERPPVGLAALPEVVLPRIYGSSLYGSFLCLQKGEPNMLERASQGYAGIFAALLLAPLAWCDRRRRPVVLWLTGIGVIGLGWCLNLPGLVAVMRLPGLNMLSYNRLVFATSFSILALAAIGLNRLARGHLRREKWFLIPVAVLAGLGGWCLFRAVIPPEQLALQLKSAIQTGKPLTWVRDAGGLEEVQFWFMQWHLIGAVLCLGGVMAWGYLWTQKRLAPRCFFLFGTLLVGDLLLHGFGQNTQAAPALYYPRIPVLQQLAKAPPGRVIASRCLPARLGEMQGLRDIRGYDAVDPAELMDLLKLAVDPQSNFAMNPAANSQWLIPRTAPQPPDGVRLSPILDMLNVRYVIFRGSPPPGIQPAFQSFDYWALINHSAMPRAFIPRRVERVADREERLRKLARRDFSPAEVAYVENQLTLPAECKGSAEIIDEVPMRVTLSLKMETPGLVVLADRWDRGWKAYLDGRPVAIERVNHAIRGVVVPTGNQTLEFRYEPAVLFWSLRVAGIALIVVLTGLGFGLWKARLRRS